MFENFFYNQLKSLLKFSLFDELSAFEEAVRLSELAISSDSGNSGSLFSDDIGVDSFVSDTATF